MVALSSLAPSFLIMMSQQVTIAPYVGPAGGGSITPTYGTAKTYPCYVLFEPQQILSHAGQEEVAAAQTNMYPQATDATLLTAWDDRNKITLPDGTTPVIKKTDIRYDFAGNLLMYVLYA